MMEWQMLKGKLKSIYDGTLKYGFWGNLENEFKKLVHKNVYLP